ncbi:ABC transporter permease [Candidatus Bathyarchaeota archaeon]|nr:ABC transporter permease [Candidatus Bathyarchaeota archaeon]
MGLRAFGIRRLLLFIPTLIGVTLLIFAVLQVFTPIQRAALYVTSPREARHLHEIIEKYHLNDPLHIQYYHWITAVLHGNLGWSEITHQPVLASMIQATPATIELVIFVIPLTILLGIYLGVKSAVHRDSAIDHVTRITSIIGWSLPTFWFAIILIAVFYGGLGWFGVGRLGNRAYQLVISDQFVRYTGLNTVDGLLNGQLWVTLDALQHLVLPVITLVVVQVALIIRVMRSSMLEELSKGYVVTARAKGLAKNVVVNKHARRNALIPTITVSGILAAGLLTGVVITETVFDYKGLGYFAAHGAMQLDIPAVLGFALFAGFMFCAANLIVDVVYGYLDPRIRLG